MKLGIRLRSTLLSLLSCGGFDKSYTFIRHLTYGPRQLRNQILNKRKEWSANPATTSLGGRSSWSDSDLYLNACNAAVTSDKDFARFKSEKSYKEILEHTGYKLGREYLRVLSDRGFQVPVDFIVRQSKIGNPEVFDYKGLGKVSPSTLRYLKVCSDLGVFFPDWEKRTIIEVGIGYGGQFCAFKELGHTGDYFGIDLEIVAALARKYTRAAGFCDGNNFHGFEGKIPNSDSHLFISNYAFSELTPGQQSFYLDNYIKKSSAGYITWNRLSELYLGGMTADHFREVVSGRILPEEPLTHPGNYLIVW